MSYWYLDVMTVLYSIMFWYLIAILIVAGIAVVLGVLTTRGDRDRW